MKCIFKFCIIILMSILINSPIIAQKSWFESTIAPWIPFFLTKNFIKEEFAQPKEEVQKLDEDVKRLNSSIFTIYERLRGLGKRITEYSNAFKDSRADTHNQFARAHQGVAEVASFHRSLNTQVRRNQELLDQTSDNMNCIKSAVDAIRDAANAHRASGNHMLDELQREHAANHCILKRTIGDHFKNTNQRLDTAWALIESNRSKIKELSTRIDEALTTAQQREEEQKNITQQIKEVHQHALDQSRKIKVFNASFAKFQHAFLAKKDRFCADAELAEASKHQIFTIDNANKI